MNIYITVAELPRTKLDSVELFEAVVTGDSLSVEKKYKDRYTITPYAKHIFTAIVVILKSLYIVIITPKLFFVNKKLGFFLVFCLI